MNKIKLIKRIVYGYRNFQNYKYRILLSFKNK
nr:transposase [Vagococcus teuberi]